LKEIANNLAKWNLEEGNGRKTCKFKIQEGLCFMWQQKKGKKLLRDAAIESAQELVKQIKSKKKKKKKKKIQ
jgi:hypothetical protein